jgi:tetratricopeptide (TPR) repeat protein
VKFGWRLFEAQAAILGPHHPDLLRTLDNLGSELNARLDSPEQEALSRRRLEVSEGAYPPGHPEVITSLLRLYTTRRALGDETKAAETLDLALERLALTEPTGGFDDWSPRDTVLRTKSQWLVEHGQREEAQALMHMRDHALDTLISRQANPEGLNVRQRIDAAGLIGAAKRLGDDWLTFGDAPRAESAFRRAVALAKNMPPEYPRFLAIEPFQRLATVCRLQGRSAEADALEQEASKERQAAEDERREMLQRARLYRRG